MADLYSSIHCTLTNWDVVACANENDRRDREERALEERRRRRQENIEENEARFGAIQLKFESIYKLDVPHEMRQALDKQKRQCEELIGVKDQLISALRAQLEERDEEFVTTLKRNAADVNGLIEEMRSQTEKYLDAYTRKLREVEDTYEHERRDHISKWDGEILQLMKLRRTREVEYRKKREAKITEEQKKMDEKHRESREEYNEIKREHLQEIHSLMEELERCKAEFLLNGERLSYNLQVLRERIKENKNTQAMNKRKLARLQDSLSSLVARYAESEKRYQRANKDLTAQLHRVAGQYRDLQKKFQLFEKSDKEKYRQLWNMHEEKNVQLVHKCLQADRVIFEEILGVPWNPPQLEYWPVEHKAEVVTENCEECASSDEEIELSEDAVMLLEILHKQAPFIENENVLEAIKQVQGVEEGRAVIESILATLQIRKSAEMEDMLQFFTVDDGDDCTALIRPQEAVTALTAFLTERQRKQKQTQDVGKHKEEKNARITRIKQEKEQRSVEREYWARMAESVPVDHRRVWKYLERGLERYLDQLKKRRSLIEQTDTLRVQNAELRDLISAYVQSDVNFQLYVQPKLLVESRGN
ncbi:Sperm tail Sperm tail C terminal domain [Trypanosoma vivax]|nr:Sperm tail Sperm tail C terminal domain [Trypanosoma vivax]